MWIDYNEYMQSPKWRTKCEQIQDRCENVCEDCGLKNMQHVHHLHYENFGDELLEDLQGLCLDCHQKRHPNRKLKREWFRIQALSKQLNVTVSFFKKAMKKEGLMERIVISRNFTDAGWGKYNKADVPTIQAHAAGMVKRQPKVKSKGQRGPWVWDLDLVAKVFESYPIPEKKDCQLPEFMKKPTKTEEYNSVLECYGVKTFYENRWNVVKGQEVVATFQIYRKAGYGWVEIPGVVSPRPSYPGQRSIEVNDFLGVVELLKEHGVLKEGEQGWEQDVGDSTR